MRAVIYARYSTEMQREASIEDQVRVCQRLIEDRGWQIAQVYSDMGMSGATHLRPGYQRLLEDARLGHFDVVLAESIDRLSRDQEHIAAFHKLMTFQGIPVLTVAEGPISELHIGLKGTMSALYLKDLAQKTRRGLEGRVKQGKSAGGVSYGYSINRSLREEGTFTTGERRIDDRQSMIVRRIFAEFNAGFSPRAIAQRLNAEGIEGPRGSSWGPSTIYGNWRRGTGILNNELYLGKMVWNRQRFIKDPSTGKRQARLNPEKDWVIEDVPDLRIIDDATWQAAKTRQDATRGVIGAPLGQRPEKARRPLYLFSGLLECGCCSGGFTLVSKTRYGCANARNKGTCQNRRTIERGVLEDRVLSGLRDQLLHPDLIAAFVSEYQREWNQMMQVEMAERTQAERDLAQVQRKIDQVVDAVTEGMFHPSMKAKLSELEARKAELEELLAKSEDQPHALRLHPGLSDVYRHKVATLTEALNASETLPEATHVLRGLLSTIRLHPEGDGLSIELVGDLAGILALSSQKQSPAECAGLGAITLVAGVGFEPTTFRL
ncbi:MAG: recombinase family protein [Rhizobiaceae bacterium]|nr:recombinase family protein [Rhizobiaceae bacterium]